MVSVRSEVLANATYQGASAKSARLDSGQSAGADSFAALIDNNAAASTADNRPQDTSTAPAPAPRRTDNSTPVVDTRPRDNRKASDNNAAPDQVTRNDSNDGDTATGPRADANADASTDAQPGLKSKSDASKSSASKPDDTTKSASKPSSGDSASATDQAKPDGSAVVIVDPIAVSIPVTVAPADASAAATPAAGNATAPLAIVAAAIVAGNAVASAASAPVSTPPATDAGTTAAATATATKADGSGIVAAAKASETVSAQATIAETPVTAGIALAASANPATTIASKTATPPKTPGVARDGAAIAGEPDSTAEATTPSATATPAGIVPAAAQQTAVTGQPKADNGIVDAVKADGTGNAASTAAANAAGKEHSTVAGVSQTLANSSDAGPQAAGTFQPQLSSTSAAPVAAGQLTVTAATQAAVPLNGLALEIATSVKSGKSRFEIRLDPADLGRIDVRIDVDRNGKVTSHLTVEKPETLSMLRQDAPQLQRALDDAGFKTDSGGLQFSLRDQSSSGQNGGNDTARNAQRLVISDDETIPAAAVAGRTYGRMLGSSSGVDIRV